MGVQSKPIILVSIVVAVVIAAAGFWYWQSKPSTPIPSGSVSQTQPAQQSQINKATADISLGSQVLEKTQNPAKDKLPETNPFQGMYKNPF